MNNNIINELEEKIILSKKEFKEVFGGIYATSNEEYIPTLQYIHLEENDVVCLDGYRLSIRKLKNKLKGEYNIHNSIIKDINKKINKFTKEIKFIFKENEYCIYLDNDLIYQYYYNEDSYVNYKNLLPNLEESCKLITNKKYFNNLYEGFRITKYNHHLPIMKINIKYNHIDIENKFWVKDRFITKEDKLIFEGNINFSNIRGLNAKYLKQVLDSYGIKDNINAYLFKSPTSPMIIESGDKSKYDLILPYRLNRK